MSHAQPDVQRAGAAAPTSAPAQTGDRAQRFARDLDALTVADPAAKRSQLWIRLGIAAMVAGVALPIIAYFLSHNTSDPLVQRDAIILALTGIAIAVVGSVVFLRFSLTGFLRFWLARQAFDLGALSERLAGGSSGAQQTTDLPVR